MHPAVEQLADELVAIVFRQSALYPFLLGMDDVPVGLDDLSAGAQDEVVAASEAVASTALERAMQGDEEFDERDVLTLDHIQLSAANFAERSRLPLVEFTVSSYPSSPLSALFELLPQLPVESPRRWSRYVECLAAVPRFLGQAAQRHAQGLAGGLTPTAKGVQDAVDQIDLVLADPELGGIRRHPVDAGDGFATSQDRVLTELVRPAVGSYRDFLRDTLLQHGRSDERCGLCRLPGGDDLYARLARTFTWSDSSPEDIHALGVSLMGRLKEEFEAIGLRQWGTRAFADVRRRILTDPAFRFTTSEEILGAAEAAVRRAEEVAPAWFGVLPSTSCAVSPVPDALADGGAVAYYFEGTDDGSRVGTYFVNTTQPAMRDRHTAEAVAYHESVPGHHFQITLAQEQADFHLVRRVADDVANLEGWALDAERLAAEMGLYGDDMALLGMLTGDALRAARLVVGTGIHALGWSRQEAIDWMAENVPMTPIEVVQEIDRYIVAPGQALAYMFGRLEIEVLRRTATERLGTQFDLHGFHDMVLATGPVALPALSAAVHRWIDTQTR